ncbi:Heterokaryon incompatibility protein [Apiospora marii]|uniref:Heterokaryon incompatibility protein n=1 Tax=Apiospora marii TaxID=335849 RepID=A0ABR1RVC7_9PEZI
MEGDVAQAAIKGQTLCTRCESLELSVDRFVFGNRPLAISRERSSTHLPKSGSRLRINSGRNLRNLARLEELHSSMSRCAFCELLYLAMQRYGSGNVNGSTACSLCWEIDRRQEDSRSAVLAKSSRRIRLSWTETNGKTQNVYIVFVPPQSSARPETDSRPQPPGQISNPTQTFDTDTEVQALIKTWLGTCLSEHQGSCTETHHNAEQFKSLVDETYFGVIDVVDMQLKELPVKDGKPGPYVALSYVWGQETRGESDYVSTRTTVMQYIERGGLEKVWPRLPSTIHDSIELVRCLGYRYLWIDAFCIVQDSGNSWKLNSEAMHLIYGNALFTICAAEGEDCSAGLRAAWSTIKPDQDRGDPMRHPTTGTDPIRIQCTPEICLMVTRPLEAVVNDSTWNTRAWTFQERILSRRCLIFAENRVYFQCRANSLSQDTYSKVQNSGASLDLMNSSIQPLQEIQQRPIWCYMKYVSMYTGRRLTKASDILAAFRGISWLLGRYLRAPLLFNLPISHFDLALLWSPTQPITLRRPDRVAASGTKGCTQDLNGNCSIRDWLKHHTWIQWYVRNEKGHLRPLWETMQRTSESELSTIPRGDYQDNKKWQGYSTRSTNEAKVVSRPAEDVRKLPSPEGKMQAAEQEARSHGYTYPKKAATRFHTREKQHADNLYPNDRPVGGIGKRTSSDPDFDTSSSAKDPTRHASYGTINDLFNDHVEGQRRNSVTYDKIRVGNKEYVTRPPSIGIDRMTRTRNPELGQKQGPVQTNAASSSDSDEGARDPGLPRYGPAQLAWDGDANGSDLSNRRLPYRDRYGRLIPPGFPRADDNMFKSILPDNPFGVIRNDSIGETEADSQYMPILQFFTWRKWLSVTIRDEATAPLSSPTADLDANTENDNSNIEKKTDVTTVRECDILDDNGDWCGSAVLDDFPIRSLDEEEDEVPFIAISDAKAFTLRECPTWNYYIPKERHESEWDLYYVLLLQRDHERGLWERRGLGKVFKAAFRNKEWAEIKLG